MKILNICEKLESLDVTLDGINLGDFDCIGEHTAKKQRDPRDPNYKRYGAFFRPNYERGILIYYMIRQLKLKSVLEIGFGRGYAALCATKAFDDSGIDGRVTSVDPNVDYRAIESLQKIYPTSWFSKLELITGKSADVVPQLTQSYDMIYIDGDHTEDGVRTDWDVCKNKFKRCVLFDDYHMPSKNDPGIQCRNVIDSINWIDEGCSEPELLLTDRRIFFDDRRYTSAQINYGQILIMKNM